jgi:hypothetical protein
MEKGIEQQIAGFASHDNLQVAVAGDLVVNLNQILAKIEDFEDLDQAIHWVRGHLELAEKKQDKLDYLRVIFFFLVIFPIPVLAMAMLMTSWFLAGAAISASLAALLPLRRIKAHLTVIWIESQTCCTVLNKLLEQKIVFQITEIRPWRHPPGTEEGGTQKTEIFRAKNFIKTILKPPRFSTLDKQP